MDKNIKGKTGNVKKYSIILGWAGNKILLKEIMGTLLYQVLDIMSTYSMNISN